MLLFKTKQEVIEHLIKNPKYESKWIDVAAELIMKGLLEEDLINFNPNQLSIILDAITANKNGCDIPIKTLLNPELNATQMELLKIAYGTEGINKDAVDSLVNPYIPYSKLNFIINGLVDKFDDIMNYKAYDAEQIAEIYAGFKDEVDYTKYALDKIPANKMSVMRYALVRGLDPVYNLENGEVTIN